MFGNCKYVMFNDCDPVLFHCSSHHVSISNRFSPKIATSAGFVKIRSKMDGEIEVIVYGESVSLKLKPKPIDDLLIKEMLTE